MSGCARFEEFILAQIDGELAPSAARELERHVASCASCARTLAAARAIEDELRGIQDVPALHGELEAQVDSIHARIDAAHTLRGFPRRIAVAAAVLVACAGAVVLFVTHNRPSEPAPVAQAPHPRPIDTRTARAEEPKRLEKAAETNVSAPVAAPHEPTASSSPESDEVDAIRLANARRALADALRDTEITEEASPQDFATRVEERIAPLAREGWPIVRLAESVSRGDDLEVARRALVFLGARGDQLSIGAVRAATKRSELAVDAYLALARLRPENVDLLDDGLRAAGVREVAMSALVRRGGQEAADALEDALRRAPRPASSTATADALGDDTREMLHALAQLGPVAVPALLRLAEQDRPSRASALDALALTPGAGERMTRIVRDARTPFDTDTLLDALERVSSAGAMAWIEKRINEPRTRVKALACLAVSKSPAALAVLVQLGARDPRTDVDDALLMLLEDAPSTAVDLTRENEERGRRRDQECLLEALTAVSKPCVVSGLVALASSTALDFGDRRLALLACAEAGKHDEIEPLTAFYRRTRERELRGAALVALYLVGGRSALSGVLSDLPPRSQDAIVAILDEPDLARRGVSAQARVARELARRLVDVRP